MSSILSDSTGVLPSDDLNPHMVRALELLLEARKRAEQTGCPAWEFAVELSQFHCAEVTVTDLRWLCRQGYVDVGMEITGESDAQRRFNRLPNLRFSGSCCFVLSESGLHLARRCLRQTPLNGALFLDPSGGESSTTTKPVWDRARQRLTFHGILVKHFRQPAANQSLLLETFEEEGWPVRIDDPLPQAGVVCPKRRLHDTILALNRNQHRRLIRFHGDGSGEGVRWEELHPDSTSATTAVL